MADAFTTALRTWPRDGVPGQAGGVALHDGAAPADRSRPSRADARGRGAHDPPARPQRRRDVRRSVSRRAAEAAVRVRPPADRCRDPHAADAAGRPRSGRRHHCECVSDVTGGDGAASEPGQDEDSRCGACVRDPRSSGAPGSSCRRPRRDLRRLRPRLGRSGWRGSAAARADSGSRLACAHGAAAAARRARDTRSARVDVVLRSPTSRARRDRGGGYVRCRTRTPGCGTPG